MSHTGRIKIKKNPQIKSESWTFTDSKTNFEFVLFMVNGYKKDRALLKEFIF